MRVYPTGAAIQGQDRSPVYYCQQRQDVARLVPAACQRVLEVGCGTGQMGQLLGARGHRVTGLELNAEAAALAANVLPEVLCADVEQGWPFPSRSFDAIVFADVLEHLVDPWRILGEAAESVDDQGVIVASIPNVQNLDVIRRLLRGRWDYRERGILDRGHLRFFTLRSIQQLFAQAGLSLVHVEHRYRRTWLREMICLCTAGQARPFFTRQYLVVAKKNA
jgi:SAM-dependent methyltransferase